MFKGMSADMLPTAGDSLAHALDLCVPGYSNQTLLPLMVKEDVQFWAFGCTKEEDTDAS